MTTHRLTRRRLNRATLARQMLLDRHALDTTEAVARLVGLQAQLPNPPYIGLWTRLDGFRRDDLTQVMGERRVVRGALMRSTLHLATGDDYLKLQPAIQPALVKALGSFFGERARGLDVERLTAEARAYIAETPRTINEIGAYLAQHAPGRDPAALGYLARTYLPLVQVPPAGAWSVGGSPTYTLADQYLGRPLATPEEGFRHMVFTYLAAFGPASVKDIQTWSGLRALKGQLDGLKPALRVFRDEHGAELLDLPDTPLPDGDTPASVRFLPEYDNLILSHADRARIGADVHRKGIFLSAGRVRATFLVDGFVAGVWKTERGKGMAALVLEPFAPLATDTRNALVAEGEHLLRFIEDKAERYEVRFAAEGG